MKNWRRAGGFALVVGDLSSARITGDAWEVYAGTRTDNTLAKLIATDQVHNRRYFVNDNYWWQYTDSQCNFHATYGWRPFFDPSYRQTDYHTWVRFFECQVDESLRGDFMKQSDLGKAPPVGFFPHSVFPEREASQSLPFFYSNCFSPGDEAHERHDEEIDYQLMNIISATDWVLFERDITVAQRVLRQVELFIQALEQRLDPDGLLLVGPQGSQIEFGHGGWRYPASTHIYLLKVCQNMVEVAGMAEGGVACQERWEKRAECLARHLGQFLQGGKWFASAIDRSRATHLGTGLVDSSSSSYFETYPNLNSIVLGVADQALAASILDRVDAIPQLTANTLVLNNYPERPLAEMDDDHHGFPPPGTHMNGGAWWMLASSLLYASAAVGHPGTFQYLRDLLHLHEAHMTIDYYNNWGKDPASQWTDKGNGDADHFSLGAAGSFGMFFRGMLGITPKKDGLVIAPRLPVGITRLKTLAPVHYGGKEVYFEIAENAGGSKGTGEQFVSYAALAEKATVIIE